MSDFGGYTHPVGRKDYRCEWCGETILRGEKHTQFTGMWEGEFQNWRMHDECHEAGSHFNDEISDGFTPYGNERPKKVFIYYLQMQI